MIIGITGSFGSGKTAVSLLFKSKGCAVINVDRLYHGLIKPKTRLHDKIIKEFGTSDRKNLRKIAFSSHKKLIKLNKLTHPAIIKRIKGIIKKSKSRCMAIDAPLLIEAKAAHIVDALIVVKCSEKNQIKRLINKGGYSKNEIKNIIKSQMPLSKKLKYADFIIDNDKSMNSTKAQVDKIWQKLK